jgi:hypothetical protein
LLEKEPVKLPKPLTLWKTHDGWILQDLAPVNALYKLVIKTAGEPYQEGLATLDDLSQSVQRNTEQSVQQRPVSRLNDTETLFTPSIEGTETEPLPSPETLQEKAEPEPQPKISQLIKDLPSI